MVTKETLGRLLNSQDMKVSYFNVEEEDGEQEEEEETEEKDKGEIEEEEEEVETVRLHTNSQNNENYITNKITNSCSFHKHVLTDL